MEAGVFCTLLQIRSIPFINEAASVPSMPCPASKARFGGWQQLQAKRLLYRFMSLSRGVTSQFGGCLQPAKALKWWHFRIPSGFITYLFILNFYFFLNIFIFICTRITYVCMCVVLHMECAGGSQGTSCERWVSPFITWVPRLNSGYRA